MPPRISYATTQPSLMDLPPGPHAQFPPEWWCCSMQRRGLEVSTAGWSARCDYKLYLLCLCINSAFPFCVPCSLQVGIRKPSWVFPPNTLPRFLDPEGKIIHSMEEIKITQAMPLAALQLQKIERVDEGGFCLYSAGLQDSLEHWGPFPASWKVRSSTVSPCYDYALPALLLPVRGRFYC